MLQMSSMDLRDRPCMQMWRGI